MAESYRTELRRHSHTYCLRQSLHPETWRGSGGPIIDRQPAGHNANIAPWPPIKTAHNRQSVRLNPAFSNGCDRSICAELSHLAGCSLCEQIR